MSRSQPMSENSYSTLVRNSMIKRGIDFTAYVLSWIVLVLAVTGYSAYYIDPEISIIPSVVGLFLMGILALNIFLFFYWAFRLHRRIVIPLITLLLGWFHLGALFPIHGNIKVQNTDETVKLMSYNIRQADPSQFDPRREVSADIAALIDDYDASIVAFQEYRSTRELDELKKKYAFATSSKSLQIWSQFPILGQGEVRFDGDYNYGGNAFSFADIAINGKPHRIYNFHISSIQLGSAVRLPESFEQLDLEESTETRRKTISLLKTGFLYREKQLDEILSHIESSPYPVFIFGDLNDTPASHAYRRLVQKFRDAHRERGIGFGRTHTNAFYPLRIDYAFDNTEFQILKCTTGNQKLSDHYPLMVEIR